MHLSFMDAIRRMIGIPAVSKQFDHTQSFQPEVRAWLAENPKESEVIGDYNHVKADRLVNAELQRQNRMWGVERDDHTRGEMAQAAAAQVQAVIRRQLGDDTAFAQPPQIYPQNWTGFRDYGSDIANLVVAAAWLHQEIARKLRAGEAETRLSRDPVKQPYGDMQPSVLTS